MCLSSVSLDSVFVLQTIDKDLTIKVVVFVSRDSWRFGLVKSVPFFGSQGFLSKSSSHSQAKRQTLHNVHDLFMLERRQRTQVEYTLHFIMYQSMANKWSPLFTLSSQLTYEIRWHETNIWKTKLFLNSISFSFFSSRFHFFRQQINTMARQRRFDEWITWESDNETFFCNGFAFFGGSARHTKIMKSAGFCWWKAAWKNYVDIYIYGNLSLLISLIYALLEILAVTSKWRMQISKFIESTWFVAHSLKPCEKANMPGNDNNE